MYVAVKGGEKAIENAHRLLDTARRGNPDLPEIGVEQIREQLSLAVDRVMSEGSLYDPELAALAVKQAQGDLVEAIFLVRAYRTTLPRLGTSRPVEIRKMCVQRRISSCFKDLPGGQLLGPTFDYTHRLLDFRLLDCAGQAIGQVPVGEWRREPRTGESPLSPRPESVDMPTIAELLRGEGLIEGQQDYNVAPNDITRDPLTFPASRDQRLQSLARADEGFVLALGYSTQRGYGSTHPFAGEIRVGRVEVEIMPEELEFAVCIGEILLTECQMLGKFPGDSQRPAHFSQGYGLVFGNCERKAMSMALVDRALRHDEFGEDVKSPAQDQEFVLSHGDNVEASGFVQHLKLPHYVDFQAELEIVRRLRAAHATKGRDNGEGQS
ncbi:carbon-phosphorus lyase complex subunit PhnI [Desulfonatronum thioautotrophicum]|uniref:carbon-phosphorus lyase complex subunit PhnI n=1 Tax=Desulfonatronum thioautotrophicum TaxID=617001 RepID=UPI0005EB724F|nr:carbon-phosphorus lyase complex subunit PhnI [Desulfonatronum thioautotrophicum]